jgi:hypothetical protein
MFTSYFEFVTILPIVFKKELSGFLNNVNYAYIGQLPVPSGSSLAMVLSEIWLVLHGIWQLELLIKFFKATL